MEADIRAWLRVLGPFELGVSGTTVPLGGARQRAILCFLALHHDTIVPAGLLIDGVWGERAPASVTKSLSTQLARLRRIVEHHGCTIEHLGSGYRLRLDAVGVDVDLFDTLAESGRLELAVGDTAAAIRAFDEALALWRGHPLDDLADAPFTVDIARQLADRKMQVEDDLACALERAGALARLASFSEQLVHDTPFREDRWARLVRALARTGRRREAIAAYDRARRLLADELGVEPGDELRQAETTARAGATGADEFGAISELPFVGRLAESNRLDAALERAPRRGLQMAVITGEPGIGKTRLVRDFTARASSDTIRLAGACDPTAAVPLGAALMALAPAVDDDLLDAVGAARHDLRFLLGTAESEHTADHMLDERARRFTIAVGSALVELARRHTLVLVIDDVQWADRLTLALLQHLATERTDVAALVVCTQRTTEARTDELERFFTDIARTTPVERIHLGPLGIDETRAVVATMARARARMIDVEFVQRASGGNPLHATQLTQLLADRRGRMPRELPDDLTAVLRARVACLDPEVASMLRAAAVIGDRFDVEIVAGTLARDPLDVADTLEVARRAGLVARSATFDQYHFVHGLLRQMIVDDLGDSRRTRLNASAARAYMKRPNPPPIEIAVHLAAAGPLVTPSRCVEPLLAGAEAAKNLAALETALDLYRAVLARTPADSAAAAAALVGAGEVELAIDEPTRGERDIDAGAALATQLGAWETVADAILARGRFGYSPSSPDARARAVAVDEVLSRLPGRKTKRFVALSCWLAHLLMNVDPAAAATAIDEAAAVARTESDPVLRRIVVCARLRQQESRAIDPRICIASARTLLTEALAAGDLVSVGHAAIAIQAARLRAGDFAWDDERDTFLEYGRQSARGEVESYLDVIDVARAIAIEPLRVAERASQAVLEEGQRHGMAAAAAVRILQHLAILREWNRAAPLEPLFVAAAGDAERNGLQGLLAVFRIEAGDDKGTAALLRSFVDDDLPKLQRDWAHETALALAADAAFEIGFVDGADEMESRLQPAAGQMVVLSSAAAMFGRVDRYLGRLAMLQGDLDLAIERFAVARELDAACGAALWAGWAARDEAMARRQRGGRGDRTRADRLLADAARAARVSGSRRLLHSLRPLSVR